LGLVILCIAWFEEKLHNWCFVTLGGMWTHHHRKVGLSLLLASWKDCIRFCVFPQLLKPLSLLLASWKDCIRFCVFFSITQTFRSKCANHHSPFSITSYKVQWGECITFSLIIE
jgi:hypothetical protein